MAQPSRTKTISSNDAKQRWGALISDVSERGEEVIVESHGHPKAVVVSMTTYEELTSLREHRRRDVALARLQRLHERVAAENEGLTEDGSLEFAVEVGREINRDVARRRVSDLPDHDDH